MLIEETQVTVGLFTTHPKFKWFKHQWNDNGNESIWRLTSQLIYHNHELIILFSEINQFLSKEKQFWK